MITPRSKLSPETAAMVVHRIYQLMAKCVNLRFSGAKSDSDACHKQAMALADMLMDPESTDETANLVLTTLVL